MTALPTIVGAQRGVLPPGTQLSGIYEIETLLATGGMGEVYRGHAIETGDPVAIKMIRWEFASDETFVGLFRKEAAALYKLQHDAVIRYYVSATDPILRRPYLAMELIEGESLTEALRRGPMAADGVLTMMERLASGLAIAHDLGIVHRDVAPDNVFLPNGDPARTKIIDFGIARSAFGGDSIIGASFAGKLNFVSPEQVGLFEGEVSSRSDIYSLGLTLAAAAAGAPIDMGGTHVSMVQKRQTVPDLSALDPRLRPILTALLQPQPKDRPGNMREVAAMARDALLGRTAPPPAAAPAAATPARSAARKPVGAIAGGIAAVLLLLGAGGFAFQHWGMDHAGRTAAPAGDHIEPPGPTARATAQEPSAPPPAKPEASPPRSVPPPAAVAERTPPPSPPLAEPEPAASTPSAHPATPAAVEPPRPAAPPELPAAAASPRPEPLAPSALPAPPAPAPVPQAEAPPPPLAAAPEPQPAPATPEALPEIGKSETPAAPPASADLQPAPPLPPDLVAPPAPTAAPVASAPVSAAAPAAPPPAPAQVETPASPPPAVPAVVAAAPVASAAPAAGAALHPGSTFEDCPTCPTMVVVGPGTFRMGSNADPSERPIHKATIAGFAIGVAPVTVAEWRLCVADKACRFDPGGDLASFVHNVSFDDAGDYLAWLSRKAGHPYRLPSEAEWEYAARGGTTTRYWWGDQFRADLSPCRTCGAPSDSPPGLHRFQPNPFGLLGVTGAVSQWTADCWHKNYAKAPADGAAWLAPACQERVLRGGAWNSAVDALRLTNRDFYDATVRYPGHGFRVARDL